MIAGASALILAGYGIYKYMRSGGAAQEETKQQVQSARKNTTPAEGSGDPFFTDPGYDTNHYLTKIEAANRSKVVSDVKYTMILGLVKGGGTYHGKITIDYNLNKVSKAYSPEGDNTECLFIDYKGKEIRSLLVNGQLITQGNASQPIWMNHRIYIPPANQVVGVNRAVIEFETFYVTDCQGFQYFKDDADGSEYIYTELEPDYCHICFPCFDQPDLKATHKTCIVAPSDWTVIANSENIYQSKSFEAQS